MRLIVSIFSMVFLLLSTIGLTGCNQVAEVIVTPKESTLPIGFELQLKAEKLMMTGLVVDVTTSNDISWSSSDDSIATVDSAGLVTAGVNTGTVTIKASGHFSGGDVEGTAVIHVVDTTVDLVTVTPGQASVAVGLSQAFTAIATFSDGQVIDITKQSVTDWSSSNPYVASISNSEVDKGVAKGELAGSSTITGSVSGLQDIAELEVLSVDLTSLSIDPQSQSIPVGLSQAFSATALLSNGETVVITTDGAFVWSVSNPEIASISNEIGTKGVAKGLSVGTTDVTISGQFNGQLIQSSATLVITDEDVTELEIQQESPTIPVGLTAQFKARAKLSSGEWFDVTKDYAISWSSTNSDRVTISNSRSNKGEARALSLGRVGITAYAEINGKILRDTVGFEVVDAIIVGFNVSPKPQNTLDTPQIPVGETKQFKADAIMSDGSLKDVTNDQNTLWISENTSVADVSNDTQSKGLARAVGEGTSMISAQYQSDIGLLQDESELTVTAPHTLSIQVSTENYSNVVQGMPVHYIGYARRIMGQYEILDGETYLDSGMQLMYIDGAEGKPIEEHDFYFGQEDETPITGALRYKATFEWPDGSSTEGVLEWQFDQKHYSLTDTRPVKNLLENEWDFILTVSNEGEQ
ncbi:Ig-like domain-containing protein [Vibrio owensii]|uniref:Ig-like domain-containing protein n=1 Tax=Vibrio owensii TaxID=696485 RepID=UPI003DA198F1